MKKPACLLAGVVFCTVCSIYADYAVYNKGTWPKSWPEELEPLRERARSLEGPLLPQLHHAIPFTKRAEFEAAWPHLLKVKSSGAPLVLRRGPSFWLGARSNAGVCIHTPPTGTEEEQRRSAAAPVGDRYPGVRREETVYIELIVDGDIVDLNRIPLPPETPIIDERFKAPKAK